MTKDQLKFSGFNSEKEYLDWLMKRKKLITGTDITAVTGANDYKTALDVYIEKTTDDELFKGNYKTKTGTVLEPVLAKILANKYKPLQKGNLIKSTDKELFFIGGTPDYITTDNTAVIEIKTTGTSIDENNIPLSWIYQASYYAGILGIKKICICWLQLPYNFNYEYFIESELYNDSKILAYILSESYFNYKEFDVDDMLVSYLFENAVDFYENNLLPGKPPPALTESDIEKYFPVAVYGETVVLADDEKEFLVNTLNEYNELSKEITALDKVKKDLQLSIKTFFGSAETIRTKDNVLLCTYKNTKEKETIDIEKLKKEYPEIYADVVVTEPGSRRLNTKVKQ